jgi:aspartyl-tRNA(Asn)/glutamyl-tRNA(Gln) amidotransferase subunit C
LAISKEEVKRVAMLARLDIDENELESMAGHFNSIIEHFNRLQALDLEGINPFVTEDTEGTPLREDVVREWRKRDIALKEAPDAEGDFFRVPRIMGEES